MAMQVAVAAVAFAATICSSVKVVPHEAFWSVKTTIKKTGHTDCLSSERAKCLRTHPPVYLLCVAIKSAHFTIVFFPAFWRLEGHLAILIHFGETVKHQ